MESRERLPLLHESRTEADEKVERNRSSWSSLTFSWVNPLLQTGVQRQLEQADLLVVPPDLAPKLCCGRLWRCWEQECGRNRSNPSLLWAIFNAYGRMYMFLGLFKFINVILAFSGPILLNQILKFLQSGPENGAQWGYTCAIAFGVVSAVRAVLDTRYEYRMAKLNYQLEASLTTMVYCKSMCLSLSQRSSFSSGEIQTFMSVDASRVKQLCVSAHDLWSLPLQIAVALGMLYIQVKFAFLAGLAVVILLIPGEIAKPLETLVLALTESWLPEFWWNLLSCISSLLVNRIIALKIAASSEKMMKEKDERVRLMGELLMFIRTVKMYTWEHIFAGRIMETRNRELKQLAIKKYLDAFCVYFWEGTPVLFTIFTFGLFVVTGHTLDAATVFTSLSLFEILTGPLNNFPWVINCIIGARVSVRRLCRLKNLGHSGVQELSFEGLKMGISRRPQRHLIIQRIAEHVLHRAPESLHIVSGQLDFALLEKGTDPTSSVSKLMEVFGNPSKRLKDIGDIPLKVVSVQPISPAFSHAEVFPPQPHPLAEDASSRKIPTHAVPLYCR